MFDADNSGTITTEELTQALKQLGHQNASRAQLLKMVQRADKDNSGTIDFPEFLEMIGDQLADLSQINSARSSALSSRLPRDELIEASKALFEEFDADGSGAISVDELTEIFKKLGSQKSESEIRQLVLEVDQDQSGEIEFDEFLVLIERLREDHQAQLFLVNAKAAFALFDTDGSGSID